VAFGFVITRVQRRGDLLFFAFIDSLERLFINPPYIGSGVFFLHCPEYGDTG